MAQTITADAIGASAMNKAMWRILPLIGLAYLFAYMDRVNVGFAAAQMNTTRHCSESFFNCSL